MLWCQVGNRGVIGTPSGSSNYIAAVTSYSPCCGNADLTMWNRGRQVFERGAGRALRGDAGNSTMMSPCGPTDIFRSIPTPAHYEGFIRNLTHSVYLVIGPELGYSGTIFLSETRWQSVIIAGTTD